MKDTSIKTFADYYPDATAADREISIAEENAEGQRIQWVDDIRYKFDKYGISATVKPADISVIKHYQPLVTKEAS